MPRQRARQSAYLPDADRIQALCGLVIQVALVLSRLSTETQDS